MRLAPCLLQPAVMGARIGFACLIVYVVAGPRLAGANANHVVKQADVRAVKQGGRVVGAKLKIQVNPYGGYQYVTLGIGDPSKAKNEYVYAQDKGKGYALHHFAEVHAAGATELELEVRYGNGVEGGKTLDVFSGWTSSSGGTFGHVWGMSRATGCGIQITFPTD